MTGTGGRRSKRGGGAGEEEERIERFEQKEGAWRAAGGSRKSKITRVKGDEWEQRKLRKQALQDLKCGCGQFGTSRAAKVKEKTVRGEVRMSLTKDLRGEVSERESEAKEIDTIAIIKAEDEVTTGDTVQL